MSTSTPPTRLDSVRALRGVAATLVVIFHIFELQRIWLSANKPGDAITAGPWAQGYAGVDLFFVISGFIMIYITAGAAGGARETAAFLKRRAIRIFPLWWVFCAILMLYYTAQFGAPVPDDFTGDNPAGYLLKSVFLIPQIYEPILGLGWTLIHEVWFYLIFAVILWLLPKYKLAALLVWAAIVFILAAAVPAGVQAGTYPKLAASYLSLEFIAGGLAAWLITKRIFIAPKLIFAAGIIASIAALCLYGDKDVTQLLWGRVAVFTLPFCALIYGAVAMEKTGGFRAPAAALWLGDVSYSLYLSHILILGVLVRLWPRLPFPDIGSAAGSISFAAAGLAASALVAGIFYYGAERPMLRVMRKRKRTS